MLKKFLCLLLTLGFTAHSSVRPTSANHEASQHNLDAAIQQMLNVINNGSTLDEIKAIIEHTTVYIEKMNTSPSIARKRSLEIKFFAVALEPV